MLDRCYCLKRIRVFVRPYIRRSRCFNQLALERIRILGFLGYVYAHTFIIIFVRHEMRSMSQSFRYIIFIRNVQFVCIRVILPDMHNVCKIFLYYQ